MRKLFFCIIMFLCASNVFAQQRRVADFWKVLSDKTVQCQLCPRRCVLPDQAKGFCQTRKNIDGKLYSLTYGRPVALHVDPIEKKPFFHVYPGTQSFSIATAGCNLRCKFCQNWEISQLDAEKVQDRYYSPEEIVDAAIKSGAKTIAFTYTEPTIFYEYMIDIAKAAKEKGIECVMHSCGYMNPEPARKLAQYIVAADIDIKGIEEKYYETFTSGSVKPVLETLKVLKEEGVWLEITNLLLPGYNDSEKDIRKLVVWVRDNLGPETPIHFSRFFPQYRVLDLSPTPLSSLKRAYKIAKEEGMYNIYIGNIPEHFGENTYCPKCGQLLIKRRGYHILENNLDKGRCPVCQTKIHGVW